MRICTCTECPAHQAELRDLRRVARAAQDLLDENADQPVSAGIEFLKATLVMAKETSTEPEKLRT